MSYQILSNIVTSISELKKNPMTVIKNTGGNVFAILNHNKPVGYCVPPEIYETMLDIIDDIEMAKLIEERKNEKAIFVDLNEL